MISEHQDRMTLTVTEAARAVGLDRRTVRRRLDGGEFPHAYRDAGREGPETGPWLIPVEDLLDAGLDVVDPSTDGSGGGPSDLSETDGLRAALADAVRRAEVAEARAAERERVIEAQELALRTLVAGVAPDGTGDSDGDGTDATVPAEDVTVPAEDMTGHDEFTPEAATGPEPESATAGRGLPTARRDDAGGGVDRAERAESPGDATGPDGRVPPAVVPYPDPPAKAARAISPGAPMKPTPPWVPIPTPPPKRRWWQR